MRPLPRPRCGTGERYSRRARTLTPGEVSAIRALAATKSLRSLGTELRVSHETVRAVLRASEQIGNGELGREAGRPRAWGVSSLPGWNVGGSDVGGPTLFAGSGSQGSHADLYVGRRGRPHTVTA